MARRKLSKQQRARIAQIQQQRRQRAAERAEQTLADSPAAAQPQAEREGRVVIRHGQHLVIADDQQQLVHCLFRQNLGHIVCGDRVLWQPTTAGQGVVTALLARDSELTRPTFGGEEKPLAANVSQLVVVFAPRPEPSEYLIDQYLIAAERFGLRALLLINKIDLLDADAATALEQRFAHYADIGYPLLTVSVKGRIGLEALHHAFAGQTSILVGQSGVGKSSLVNALLPDLDLQTGRLSDASGLGRHTTSTTTLYRLADEGGFLIDSPGVRSFRLGEIDRTTLQRGFAEFAPFLGHCQYRDCRHDGEPGCALAQAERDGLIHPLRLKNFRHMAQSLAR